MFDVILECSIEDVSVNETSVPLPRHGENVLNAARCIV